MLRYRIDNTLFYVENGMEGKVMKLAALSGDLPREF
jgi:hypothetical protein